MAVLSNTTVVLRRHPGGAWVVENRYTVGHPDPFRRMPSFDHDSNPGTPPLHQIGITVYTDFDSINTHFGPGYDPAGAFYQNYSVTRPPQRVLRKSGFAGPCGLHPVPALTESALAAPEVYYPNRTLTKGEAPLAVLPVTGAGAYLGDNANQPLGPDPETWRLATFGPYAGEPQAAFGADFDHDGLQNGVEYALGQYPLTANVEATVVAGTGVGRATLSFRPDDSASAHVTLEVEASELLSAGTWLPIVRRTAGEGVWSVLASGATVVENASTGWVMITDAVADGDRRFLGLGARPQ